MRSYKTQGIIIKRNNFGEADRILTVFTKNEGLIKVKAKGVRKISSRRASHIELLNLSTLSLYLGPRLPILTEAQTINSFPNLKADLGKIGLAYHICELINGLCAQHQENRMVFNLMLDTLEKLELDPNPRELIKGFEVELLTLLGFWNRDKTTDNIHSIIENILERKLKTARILPLFAVPAGETGYSL